MNPYFYYRSLWYITHGFQSHFESSREVIGTGQCQLKYNYKGGQSERVISPIKLKQLFIPFVILICGLLLAFFQFLRELMHAHFERQMMNQVDSAPTAVTTADEGVVDESTDTDPSSSQSEKIAKDFELKAVPTADAPVVTMVTVAVRESPLVVVDISSDDSDDKDEAV